jgi:hypothetical protein
MGTEAYRKTTRARTIVLAVLAALILAGSACADRRFDALMRSWEGQAQPDLFRTWGPPDYIYADGGGGRVAVYIPLARPGDSRRSPESERLRAASSTRVFDPALKATWPIFRIFYIDAQGRVSRTEWRGDWECCSN